MGISKRNVDTGRIVTWVALGFVILGIIMLFTGCTRIRAANTPPQRYDAGQNFGDSGATPCTDAYGNPCVNVPKQWLECCGAVK